MNIEHIRQAENLDPGKFVLHIGEENAKYWLDSYFSSRYGKVFWTAPSFYSRSYDTTALERATVEKYTNPWYYIIKCRIKDDGLLTSGLDDSYSSDLDFRMSFATENIKAIVIDENPTKIQDLKMFFDKSKTALNLCGPDLIYVRAGLEELVDDYAKMHGLGQAYYFDVGINRTLDQRGSVICSYAVYIKERQ